MAEDFYSTLGVPKNADADAIKKAYRKLARDLHPDKNPGDAKGEARFKAVNRAFEVLHDKDKRQIYDEFGEEGLREGFDVEKARAFKNFQQRGGRRGGVGGMGGQGVPIDIEDLFGGGGFSASSFGGGGFADAFANARRRPSRGSDIEQPIRIDFISAVKGTSLELRSAGAETVTVRVPAGANNGSRIRIRGHGAPSRNGGPPGDLILVTEVAPHPLFTREGEDLYLDVPITVSEAFHGAKVKVPTIDGAVTVKVPPQTQSGTKLRLRGKGVARKGKESGDMYVRFMVHIPVGSAPELAELVSKLGAFEAGEPLRANLKL
ncbi:MAG: DnaJ domain-containing protein [Myxococcales bacterium]|nr:DnaJ domain-containing protein [Myxococcales bacterium]